MLHTITSREKYKTLCFIQYPSMCSVFEGNSFDGIAAVLSLSEAHDSSTMRSSRVPRIHYRMTLKN